MPQMLDASVSDLRAAIRDWRAALPPAVCPGDLLTYDAVFFPLQRGEMREPTHRSGALEQRVDQGRFVCPPPEVDLYAILDAVGRARPLEAYGNKRDFTRVGAQALAQLEDALPRYAVPKLLKSVDTIPLLPTGKANKKALPDVTGELLQEPAAGAASRRRRTR